MGSVLDDLGLYGNLGAFALAALVILVAGSKLEALADRIATATGLGQVFAGTVLLAVATSLPELATVITASVRGHTGMAVSNLLGGVIFQTLVLTLADTVGGRGPMTGKAPSYGLLLQGVGLIAILAMVAIAAPVEAQFRGVRAVALAGPVAIALAYVLVLRVVVSARSDPRWTPVLESSPASEAPEAAPVAEGPKGSESVGPLLLRFGFGSALVFLGGWAVVVSVEHVAAATGASTSFLGFTLVAIATSLPEISTTVFSARRGRLLTAMSNVFGSNGFDVSLLLVAALLSDGPVFADAVLPSVFSAALGILLTAIYLVGALERRDRSFLRMGVDSMAVLLLSAFGVSIMYLLDQG